MFTGDRGTSILNNDVRSENTNWDRCIRCMYFCMSICTLHSIVKFNKSKYILAYCDSTWSFIAINFAMGRRSQIKKQISLLLKRITYPISMTVQPCWDVNHAQAVHRVIRNQPAHPTTIRWYVYTAMCMIRTDRYKLINESSSSQHSECSQ